MLVAARQVLGFILNHPVGGRRPVRCISRFAGWQVRSRLRTGPHVVPFVGRTRLWARSGETGISGNIHVGLHEFAEMAFVLHALRPGDLFADVGANAGSYTVLASGVVGARTVAIEPVAETAARLEQNIALNNLGGLARIERCAVGAIDGTVRFSTSHDTTNRIAEAGTTGPSVEVPLRRLDTLFGDECPKIVKLDVEGHDREALAGAAALLPGNDLEALIIEVSRHDPNGIVPPLAAHGFTPCRYDPFERRLTPTPHALDDANSVFVRDPEALQRRLRNAPAFAILGLDI